MNLSGEERIYREKNEFIRRRTNLSGEEQFHQEKHSIQKTKELPKS
ncbi:hypothetical protein [Virgibacillus doumboii]|nr:hypothetical protein [Virgibacillus doumboii]